MLGAHQGPWIRKIAFIWSQVHLVVEPALFAKALCNLGNKWVLWMIECFVFRIYPDQTDFSETSENAKCFWCSFAFLPSQLCYHPFGPLLGALVFDKAWKCHSCRYFYLSFPPPLLNIEPDQAMNIAWQLQIFCGTGAPKRIPKSASNPNWKSTTTKSQAQNSCQNPSKSQWVGRKVSSGKPRIHLQAAVVAHPIASLISKTKPLPKSNGFNVQRRIPCRPSVPDFNRFLTPWHHWLLQIYSVYIVLDLSLEQLSRKKIVKKNRLKQGKSC